MFFRKALQIAILFLMSCGQPMVDLNELETFFRGREVLFDNDLSNNCQYTMRKTTNGLEIKHKLILDYKEFYSYHDFEITEKFELGEMSNYFEIGRFKVIGQANRTYMFFGLTPCIENFFLKQSVFYILHNNVKFILLYHFNGV